MSQLLARVQAAALAAAAADAGVDIDEEIYIDHEPVPLPQPKPKKATKKAAATAAPVAAPAAAPIAAPQAAAAAAPQTAPLAAPAEAHEGDPISSGEVNVRELLGELSSLKAMAALGAGAGSVVIITGPVTLNFRREDGDSPAGFVKLPPLKVAKGAEGSLLAVGRK